MTPAFRRAQAAVLAMKFAQSSKPRPEHFQQAIDYRSSRLKRIYDQAERYDAVREAHLEKRLAGLPSEAEVALRAAAGTLFKKLDAISRHDGKWMPPGTVIGDLRKDGEEIIGRQFLNALLVESSAATRGFLHDGHDLESRAFLAIREFFAYLKTFELTGDPEDGLDHDET